MQDNKERLNKKLERFISRLKHENNEPLINVENYSVEQDSLETLAKSNRDRAIFKKLRKMIQP